MPEPAARRKPGPKPRFTQDELVDVALAIVDAEGFHALSLRAVARELGVTSMAIYTYVESRDELYGLVLDRLISIAVPRIRDFRGLPTKFDGSGNYTFGVTEQLIFPEVDYDKIDTTRGMNITIVTTAETDDQGRALLRALGFPFRRDGQG